MTSQVGSPIVVQTSNYVGGLYESTWERVAGGTLSDMTGDKFGNGATTIAFARAANQVVFGDPYAQNGGLLDNFSGNIQAILSFKTTGSALVSLSVSQNVIVDFSLEEGFRFQTSETVGFGAGTYETTAVFEFGYGKVFGHSAAERLAKYLGPGFELNGSGSISGITGGVTFMFLQDSKYQARIIGGANTLEFGIGTGLPVTISAEKTITVPTSDVLTFYDFLGSFRN